MGSISKEQIRIAKEWFCDQRIEQRRQIIARAKIKKKTVDDQGKQKRLESCFWYNHRNTEEEETAFALMNLRNLNKEQLKSAKEWFCARRKEQHR